MCGIAGIIRWRHASPPDDDIKTMTRALSHRGPDGEGVFISGQAAIGHRRLAIIDLAGGAQPMANENESVWVTFNGEIYNYRELRRQLESLGHIFNSNSDTEAIVHGYEEWGADCVQRFRGMFAFGIVDLVRQSLFLARDHFGIKPLYYWVNGDQLAFASELAALTALPQPPASGSLQAIEYFLRYQYIPSPQTIYADVYKLPPAHSLELNWNVDRPPLLAPRRYWDFKFQEDESRSVDDWLDTVDAALDETVNAQLMADVPFGVLLSGGVDSTLVSAKIREQCGRSIQAFTIAFDDEQCSELPFARQAAERLDLELCAEVQTLNVADELDAILRHFGEPFGDSSALPTWHVCRLARSRVPLVFSGDGGDESFGGYGSYRHWLRTPLEAVANAVGQPWKTNVLGAYEWMDDLRSGRQWRCEHWQRQVRYFSRRHLRKLWRPEMAYLAAKPCPLFEDAARRAPLHDSLSFAQYMDFQTYLPGAVLPKVDIASMAHGLEVRPPLLDHRLVELAAQLPTKLRWKRGRGVSAGKRVLRKLLKRLFSADFVDRRKQGFAIPRQRWLLPGTPLADRLHDVASGRLREFFDPAVMKQTIEAHNQTNDNSAPLWLLLTLGIWLEQNPKVTFS